MSAITEVPVGTIDGVNQTFSTSRPYRLGSLAVFRNGQLLARDLDDGWVEVGPDSGVFELKVPPVSGDTLLTFYAATGGGGAEQVLTLPLKGRIDAVVELTGRLVRT